MARRSVRALRADDAVIDGEPARVDPAGGDGGGQCAVRFAIVVTVAEAALPEAGAKFAETVFDILAIKVAEAEFLQPR